MSQKYRVNIKNKWKEVDRMSIYGDFLSDLKISETKRWKADLKNKTLIKCINTQIMSQIRYFIGPIIFSVRCLNKIDGLIRKALYEINFISNIL